MSTHPQHQHHHHHSHPSHDDSHDAVPSSGSAAGGGFDHHSRDSNYNNNNNNYNDNDGAGGGGGGGYVMARAHTSQPHSSVASGTRLDGSSEQSYHSNQQQNQQQQNQHDDYHSGGMSQRSNTGPVMVRTSSGSHSGQSSSAAGGGGGGGVSSSQNSSLRRRGSSGSANVAGGAALAAGAGRPPPPPPPPVPPVNNNNIGGLSNNNINNNGFHSANQSFVGTAVAGTAGGGGHAVPPVVPVVPPQPPGGGGGIIAAVPLNQNNFPQQASNSHQMPIEVSNTQPLSPNSQNLAHQQLHHHHQNQNQNYRIPRDTSFDSNNDDDFISNGNSFAGRANNSIRDNYALPVAEPAHQQPPPPPPRVPQQPNQNQQQQQNFVPYFINAFPPNFFPQSNREPPPVGAVKRNNNNSNNPLQRHHQNDPHQQPPQAGGGAAAHNNNNLNVAVAAAAGDKPRPLAQTRLTLRVATCNVLFEHFYRKHGNVNNFYNYDQRLAAFRQYLHAPPLRDADAICFQEFSWEQVRMLNELNFEVYTSHGARETGNAYVATALRRNVFVMPALEVTHVPLDASGAKALLLTQVIHAPTGRVILIGNAHVPWSETPEGFHASFHLMHKLMTKQPAAIFCGDFNTDPDNFFNSLSDDDSRDIFNAVPEIPFTSLGPHGESKTLDQIWYRADANCGGGTGAFLVRNPVEMPSIVLPSNLNEMMRHNSAPNQHDYTNYFSDHAIVVADFEIEQNFQWPARGSLLRMARVAEQEALGRAQGVSLDMTDQLQQRARANTPPRLPPRQ